MTTDGFRTDPESLRALAASKGGALIDSTSEARSRFADAAMVRSSFPESMSAQQQQLDTLLGALADAAGDAVRIAEDYRERLLSTADTYQGNEQTTTADVTSVEL